MVGGNELPFPLPKSNCRNQFSSCGSSVAVLPALPPSLQHYRLVDDKELAPLQELIDEFMGRGAAAAVAH